MAKTPKPSTRPVLTLAPDLDAPLELATEAIAILGRRGSGKTNTAVVLAEELIGAGVQTIVVDTVGVWWGLRSSADGKHPGLDVVVFGGEHGDVPLEELAGRLIADAILDHQLNAVVDTSLLRKQQAKRFLLDFVTQLYERKARDRHPVHVIFDEADELAPQRPDTRNGSAAAALLGAMEDFVRRGRSRGLGATCVTQRSSVLAKDVLFQVEVLIAMQMTGPADRASIDAWTSQHADEEQARRVKATLPTLTTGTGWVWSPTLLAEPLHQVRFRERRTFDSSATPKVGETRYEPTARSQIDLAQLGEQIAVTVKAAEERDPNRLRERIAQLERDLATARAEQRPERVEVPVIAASDVDELRAIADQLRDALGSVSARLEQLPAPQARAAAAKVAPQPSTAPTPASRPAPTEASVAPPLERPVHAVDEEPLRFRTGAERMLRSLGRMYPLRLTKGQWGMVANLKTSGGTWSTYLGELRRAGLIDENHAGFTLTPAGFDYLGGQPAPMTSEELITHYRGILRSGAVRMLDALIEIYPATLDRDEISDASGIAASGGTFSTYLGELTRNGLVERTSDGGYRTTDVLMRGAAAAAS